MPARVVGGVCVTMRRKVYVRSWGGTKIERVCRVCTKMHTIISLPLFVILFFFSFSLCFPKYFCLDLCCCPLPVVFLVFDYLCLYLSNVIHFRSEKGGVHCTRFRVNIYLWLQSLWMGCITICSTVTDYLEFEIANRIILYGWSR